MAQKRDINNKFWDEELETMPREQLEKQQLKDLKEIVNFAYEKATLSFVTNGNVALVYY